MASTTDWVAVLVVLAAGCSGPKDPPHPGSAGESGGSSAPTIATAQTASTGDTAATGPTGDTGPAPIPYPPCDHVPVTTPIRLTGNEAGDAAGFWVDAADVDGDGCDEVMVTESYRYGDYPAYPLYSIHSAVYLLQDPWGADGLLGDAAFTTFLGSGEDDGLDNWGDPARLVPAAGQIVIGGFGEDFDAYHTVQTLNLPVDGGVVAAIGDGVLDQGGMDYSMGGSVGTTSACVGAGGPAVCVTSLQSALPSQWDGCTWLFDAPLVGEVPVLDARARYIGDPADEAEIVLGDGDVDGDGVNDLLIGAYGALGTGRVAVLAAPPDGDHRVWDVADATLTGEVYAGELGLGLAVGDLDGDGYGDVLAGAPLLAGGGAAYGFAGPLTGDHPVSSADWTVNGTATAQWVGYDAAIGDLDGDGAADLAVGAPWSIYSDLGEGRVLLFSAPVPGTYTDLDAPVVLTSGAGVSDGFGFHLEGGDIDGDGLYDLVVGAPTDPTAGWRAGSATIVFGASLP